MLRSILVAATALAAVPLQAAVQLDSSYAYFATVRDFEDFEPGLGTSARSFDFSDIGGCEGSDEQGGGRCGGYESSGWTLTLASNSFDYAAGLSQNHAIVNTRPNTDIYVFALFRADREMRLRSREFRSISQSCAGACSNNLWSNIAQYQLGNGSWRAEVQLGTAAATSEGIQNIGHRFTLPIIEVPEPGAWAMLIIGFGAIGGAQRRRRTLLPLGQQ